MGPAASTTPRRSCPRRRHRPAAVGARVFSPLHLHRDPGLGSGRRFSDRPDRLGRPALARPDGLRRHRSPERRRAGTRHVGQHRLAPVPCAARHVAPSAVCLGSPARRGHRLHRGHPRGSRRAARPRSAAGGQHARLRYRCPGIPVPATDLRARRTLGRPIAPVSSRALRPARQQPGLLLRHPAGHHRRVPGARASRDAAVSAE